MKDKGAGRKAPRTKTGCWTCRERKVRCDEKKPICLNCSRLGLGCAGYGARITFRDDTPRVVQRMDSVTDTQGCSVYDMRDTRVHKLHAPLRYKTYTPRFFEKHKDIEVEVDLLEPADDSPISSKDASPFPTGHGMAQYTTGPGYNNAVPDHRGQQYRPWGGVATPQRSPIVAGLSQYPYPGINPSLQNNLPPTYQGRAMIPDYAYQSSNPSSTEAYTRHLQPQIIVDTMLDPVIQSKASGDPSNAYGLLTPGSLEYMSNDQKLDTHSLVPPVSSNRSRRSTNTSENSDSYSGPSPSSLKWAEHFGGQDSHNVTNQGDNAVLEESQEDALQAIANYTRTLRPSFGEDDQIYLRHYFHDLVTTMAFPDRGPQSPFRVLLLRLCPCDAALIHAVLALAATNLAHIDHKVDSDIRFSHAQAHYDRAQAMIQRQLEYSSEAQSTAALTTAYFLDLVDVKNCIPIRQTDAVLSIVKSRSAAGRIYEGGICWTWYNATLGVISALFGGPVLVMPYLIETDQLPTPGQGNMFPFIKKSEEERIEHTVISPMYVSQLRSWVLLSKLAVLANSDLDVEGEEFAEALGLLKQEIETSWQDRAKIVDDLIVDVVEEVFLTKWQSAVPVAQSIVLFYHSLQLYTELLRRGSYAVEELKRAVDTIVSLFDKIASEGQILKRRFVLVPIFLCSILCPDLALRRQVIHKIAQAVGTEASWKKALEVAKALLQEEMTTRETQGESRGSGSIRWRHVHQRLGGIALF